MADRLAIDFSAAQIEPSAIKKAGYEAVVAYLSDARPSAPWMKSVKPLTRAYADRLRAGGVDIVSNYQYGKTGDATPSDWRGGYAAGKLHGKKALDNHFAAGGPGWRPCFAPCDDNPTDEEIDKLVLPFIQGWAEVWGKEWTGIYANRRTWDRLKSKGAPVSWFWQHNWDGLNDGHPHHKDAHIHQIRIDKDQVSGIGVDVNVILKQDYGQWALGGVDPRPVETFPITKYRMNEMGHYSGHGRRRLRVYFHTSEGKDWVSTARGTADYQVNQQNGSYHLLIDDTEIIQTVSLKDTAWGVLSDNDRSIQICLILSSGATGYGPTARENQPKSRAQWLEHEKMMRMARFALRWVLDELEKMGEPVPMRRVDIAGVGRNEMGISSHNNYTYGSSKLIGYKDGTHWDCPDSLPYDVLMSSTPTPVDPDAFPLPAGYYFGPLDGPEQSISGQYEEPQSWIDGLKRWQTAVGIKASGVWDGETKRVAQQLQMDKKWQKSPGDGFVYLGEWNAVIREGWTPKPVEVKGLAHKLVDLTGLNETGKWGLGFTDLGAMAQAPNGDIVAVFGDTFKDKVGGADWRSPVILIGRRDAQGIVRWDHAGGPDREYARQLWAYKHDNSKAPGTISTVIPSDLLTVGDTMYLHVIVNRGFGNVVWTEIWQSKDNGQNWTHCGEQSKADGAAGGGYLQCVSWDYDPADGYVYIVSTGFQRDKGLVLRRCKPAQIVNQSSWEAWSYMSGKWAWRTKVVPSVITPAGEKWGELTLRKLDGGWVLGGLLGSEYGLVYRVVDSPIANMYTAPKVKLINGVSWAQDDGSKGNVAQCYGGYVVPGSKLGVDNGLHLAVSQWNTTSGFPYHVMQFAGRLEPVNNVPRDPGGSTGEPTETTEPENPINPNEGVSEAVSQLKADLAASKERGDAEYAAFQERIAEIERKIQ
ncbi:lysin A [Gordonia phage Soos]|nr:lysin A [Gordonia phage Soos]